MEYRKLGATGVAVSEIGLTSGPGVVDASSIRQALERGCTFFDTMPGDELAVFTHALDGRRRDVTLSLTLPATRDLESTVERSLDRLHMDYLDLCQVHHPSPEMIRAGEFFPSLDRLKASGKIRWCGVSVRTPEEGIEAIRSGRVDTVQIEYNLFQPAPARALFPIAKKNKIGVIVRDPFGAALEKTEPLRFLQREGRRTLAQAALQFVLANDAVATAISPCKTLRQVEEHLGAMDAEPLDEHELEQIFELIAGCFEP